LIAELPHPSHAYVLTVHLLPKELRSTLNPYRNPQLGLL
jgi:hypothetical protein